MTQPTEAAEYDIIQDPGRVRAIIEDLMDASSSHDEGSVHEADEDSGGFSVTGSPTASMIPKSKEFLPRGEGGSGMGTSPQVHHKMSSQSTQVSPITGIPKKKKGRSPKQGKGAPPRMDTLVPAHHHTPPFDEVAGPGSLDTEELRWATKTDLDELTMSLDDFLRHEVKEALSPITRDLNVALADIKALTGTCNTLLQKMAALQTRVSTIEKGSLTVITSDTRQPSTTVTGQNSSGLSAVTTSDGYLNVSAEDKPYTDFLKTNPVYISNRLLRQVKLQALATSLNKRYNLKATGSTDWTVEGLRALFD